MTIDLTVVISTASLGTALGLMLSELRNRGRAIKGFNGEKDRIQRTLTEMSSNIQDLTDESIRRSIEQESFRKRLVKVETSLKLRTQV